MEDSEMVMENLDSLWFFANVLSPRNEEAQLDPPTEENALKVELSQTQTMAPILQNCETPSPISLISVPKECPKCREIGLKPVQPLGEVMKENGEEGKTSRRRRKRRNRNIVGEGGGGFGVDFEFWKTDFYRRRSHWQLNEKEAEACERFKRDLASETLLKMPPMNDGIAMKEHLRSWAHAVACIVR